jgi:hypothetical protein
MKEKITSAALLIASIAALVRFVCSEVADTIRFIASQSGDLLAVLAAVYSRHH